MKRFTLSLLAVLLFALPAVSQAALRDYFVSTDWLAKNRNQVVVIDVRATPKFMLGHIVGAQNVPKENFLTTRNGVKSLVPSAGEMTTLLSRLGVTAKTPLVVYAEDGNPYAARLVWTLLYSGHRQAYVLDGGYNKWFVEKRATSLLLETKPKPSHYVLVANTAYSQTRVESDYVYTRLGNPGTVVWDTRSDGEYAGTDVRADRGGHIPGAVHLNWTNLLTKVDGVKVLKDRATIEALLQKQGLTADKEIVPHCQTGIRSAYATLVLLGLGYDHVRNFDGSWIEWANNPNLPIINTKGVLVSSNYAGMN